MKFSETAVVRAVLLDRKLEKSYDGLEREKKWGRSFGRIELTIALIATVLFLLFIFWGAGYSIFVPQS